MLPPAEVIDDCVARALAEDLGDRGDWTTSVTIPVSRRCRARIVVKAAGVIAGLPIARRAFAVVEPAISFDASVDDGTVVAAGDLVARIAGPVAAVLTAERTALNFLQRLSGVATATRALVDAVAGTGARILDTRKTTPGLRAFEKYAVRVAGGENHRIGLYDQVLIKENHFAGAAPDDFESVVARAVAASPRVPVVVEARTRDEAVAAVRGGAGVVLLDNFSPGDELRAVIAAVRDAAAERPVEVEVSGGVTLATVREFAACGVDRISVGAITHSAPALDLSLLVEVES